ncbi:MAG: glycine zipper 2TM domain-containing protein [Wenzhouxiangella sp.]
MKRKTIVLTATALTASLLALGAQAGGVSYFHAPVVSAQPEYQTVRTPINREVCWEEQHYERERRSGSSSATPTIVGAIIGGVVGNQFGGGSGNTAATVAGAALGGSIGRDAGRQNRGPDRYHPVTSERCTIQRDYREENRISGYLVTYEHGGQLFTTRTTRHPGDSIRIRVSHTPVP